MVKNICTYVISRVYENNSSRIKGVYAKEANAYIHHLPTKSIRVHPDELQVNYHFSNERITRYMPSHTKTYYDLLHKGQSFKMFKDERYLRFHK